jgi:Protein of unknown function (DUF2589)
MANGSQPPAVSSRVLDLDKLFGAPLVSVIEADVLASREFARFITEYGFVGVTDGAQPSGTHLGELRTVSFSYKRPTGNGSLEDAVVEIPVLSLIPLPLLQVTDAEFAFNVRILDTDPGGPGTPPPLVEPPKSDADAAQATPLPPPQRPRVRAMLAQAQPDAPADGGARRSEMDANMSVKIAMKQSDVPAGIGALLNLMGQSIHARSQA